MAEEMERSGRLLPATTASSQQKPQKQLSQPLCANVQIGFKRRNAQFRAEEQVSAPDEIRLCGSWESVLLHHLPGEPGLRFGSEGTDVLRSPCWSSRADARALHLPKPWSSLFAHRKTVTVNGYYTSSRSLGKGSGCLGSKVRWACTAFPPPLPGDVCRAVQYLCHLGWSSPVLV